MKDAQRKYSMKGWTIVAFLICALLIPFAAAEIKRLILTENINEVLRGVIVTFIYAIPTIALLYLGRKLSKHDALNKKQNITEEERKKEKDQKP